MHPLLLLGIIGGGLLLTRKAPKAGATEQPSTTTAAATPPTDTSVTSGIVGSILGDDAAAAIGSILGDDVAAAIDEGIANVGTAFGNLLGGAEAAREEYAANYALWESTVKTAIESGEFDDLITQYTGNSSVETAIFGVYPQPTGGKEPFAKQPDGCWYEFTTEAISARRRAIVPPPPADTYSGAVVAATTPVTLGIPDLESLYAGYYGQGFGIHDVGDDGRAYAEWLKSHGLEDPGVRVLPGGEIPTELVQTVFTLKGAK